MTTSNMLIKYPLDLTGQSPNNLVPNEVHTAPREQARGFGLNYGGFFTESLRITHVATGRPLVKGTDYICLELIQRAFEASGQEVCAAVMITNDQLDGDFSVTYQAIGGEFSTNVDVINALLVALALDNRPVKWGDLIGLPDAFPPEDHYHTPDDLYGFEYLVEALERVRSAILLGDYYDHDEIRQRIENLKTFLLNEDSKIVQMLQAHLDDTQNPHRTNKNQVGLGLVDNFATANQAEAEAGTLNDKFMTPLRVAQAISKLIGDSFNAHVNNTANPHNTTAAQVGLGLVQNYGIASQAQAEAGTDNGVYMTALRVGQAIAKLAIAPLNAHISNTANPHNTTATQVGLGLVSNYATAVAADVASFAGNKFMTPAMTKLMIDSVVSNGLAAHLNDKTNPHDVTAAQVGLGLVQNYGIASQAQAEAGADNGTYMTPLRVAQAINKIAGNALSAHINNTSNPHSTTAAQVGLGLVQNYGIASQAQAEAGSDNATYMTPLRVAQAINKIAGNALNTHINNTANPHNTTATQVGLGLVQNYGIASQAQAEAGTDNASYMTPLRVKQAIAVLASNALTAHINDGNNPHRVTPTQIGLGNVQNYGIAPQAVAEAGTDNASYMTPLRTFQAIARYLAIAGWSTVTAHLSRTDNPHSTTAVQVGLGNVQNFGIASQADAEGLSSNTTYITPWSLYKALVKFTGLTNTSEVLSQTWFHLTNNSNPHQVNKDQVGLSLVKNYPPALAGNVILEGPWTNRTDAMYMTPYKTWQAIYWLLDQLQTRWQVTVPRGTWYYLAGSGGLGDSSYLISVRWSRTDNGANAFSYFNGSVMFGMVSGRANPQFTTKEYALNGAGSYGSEACKMQVRADGIYIYCTGGYNNGAGITNYDVKVMIQDMESRNVLFQ